MNDIERSIIQGMQANHDWINGGKDEAKIMCYEILYKEANKRGWDLNKIKIQDDRD